MTWDLKIVGGRIIDGDGGAAFDGDVAIKDGRIVEVGRCEGTAARTIDVRGTDECDAASVGDRQLPQDG